MTFARAQKAEPSHSSFITTRVRHRRDVPHPQILRRRHKAAWHLQRSGNSRNRLVVRSSPRNALLTTTPTAIATRRFFKARMRSKWTSARQRQQIHLRAAVNFYLCLVLEAVEVFAAA